MDLLNEIRKAVVTKLGFAELIPKLTPIPPRTVPTAVDAEAGPEAAEE